MADTATSSVCPGSRETTSTASSRRSRRAPVLRICLRCRCPPSACVRSPSYPRIWTVANRAGASSPPVEPGTPPRGLRNPVGYGRFALSHIGKPAGPHRRVGGGQLMRFGVLGPLQVYGADDEDVVLPGAGPRVVLALLLAHAHPPVPVDTMVEAAWPGPPPRPRASQRPTYRPPL